MMKDKLYDLCIRCLEVLIFRGLTGLRLRLLSLCTGQVLEIGTGTGQNIRFYPTDISLILSDIKIRQAAIQLAIQRGGKWSSIDASAEDLPLEAESLDTVVSTLVLCSVTNPEQALAEIHRVLKPGGKALLLEHVRLTGRVAGKIQDLITPLWKRIAGGCHLNRDIDAMVIAAGFKTIERQILWNGLGRFWVAEK